jgi:AcrR family transcriptional regulator
MPRILNGLSTADAIREAAAELFHQHGYEATSLRQVAAEVGIQVGSLYNHISGKETLLRWIMVGIMEDLLAAQQEALAAHKKPLDQLRAMLDVHIRFHASRARDVFIGNSELRALSAECRAEVIRLRDRYELTLREVIERVAAEGRADVLDIQLQVFAIIAIGAHVSSWYRPEGTKSLDEIVETYIAMVFRQLGIATPGRRRTRATTTT